MAFELLREYAAFKFYLDPSARGLKVFELLTGYICASIFMRLLLDLLLSVDETKGKDHTVIKKYGSQEASTCDAAEEERWRVSGGSKREVNIINHTIVPSFRS